LLGDHIRPEVVMESSPGNFRKRLPSGQKSAEDANAEPGTIAAFRRHESAINTRPSAIAPMIHQMPWPSYTKAARNNAAAATRERSDSRERRLRGVILSGTL